MSASACDMVPAHDHGSIRGKCVDMLLVTAAKNFAMLIWIIIPCVELLKTRDVNGNLTRSAEA